MAYVKKVKVIKEETQEIPQEINEISFPFSQFDKESYERIVKLKSFYESNLKTTDEGRIQGGSYQGLLELGYSSKEEWIQPLILFNQTTDRSHPEFLNNQHILIAFGYYQLHSIKL